MTATCSLLAAPAYDSAPGVLNSAGSLKVQGEVSHMGSMGQLGRIISSKYAQAFGGFFHTFELAATADADGDGLSDAFDVDNDNDGSSDIRELIAGTAIFDASDVLRISSIQGGADGISIRWPGKAGRAYRLLRFDEAGAVSPTMQLDVGSAAEVQADGKTLEFIDRDAVGSGFYSIEVKP